MVETARRLRRTGTATEEILWQRLRRPHVLPFVFRRQHPVGVFVVDFYCPQAGLVVELDGGVHANQHAEDRARQEFLESRGLRVLRFTNDEVRAGLDDVVRRIRAALQCPDASRP